jgi:hypothetical protein
VQPAFKSAIHGSGEGIAAELPGSLRGSLKPGTELSGFQHGQDAVLLLRAASEATGYVAGTMESLSVAEILSHIVGGTKTGRLIVDTGSARKTVNFRDGQIIFATSTEPHERLGRQLVRLKVVTPDVLSDALALVRPGKKIGQVLTSSGQVTPRALYSAMTFLVREITLSLFELTEGTFCFLEGPQPSENILRLPERTRTILLEGMKRSEEVQRLRRRVPLALRVRRGHGPSPQGSENLLSAAGAGTDLAALRSSFDGGEYAFLGAVDELLRSGALLAIPEKTDSRRAAVSEAPSPVQLYAALLKTICDALRSSGKGLKDLQSFFSDPLPGMEEAFAGVTLSDDGNLDFNRVMANVGSASSPLRRAKAYEALDGFICYALFSAKNAMSPELAESLSVELRRIQSELS